MATITETEERIRLFRTAWRELAQNQSFAGMTLGQFDTATEPALALRAEIEALGKQIEGKKTERSATDRETLELLDMVVNSVRGTPGYGPDSALYRALGYVRKSERRSGLSRRKSSPPMGGQEETAV